MKMIRGDNSWKTTKINKMKTCGMKIVPCKQSKIKKINATG
jgi:hypothetical protein